MHFVLYYHRLQIKICNYYNNNSNNNNNNNNNNSNNNSKNNSKNNNNNNNNGNNNVKKCEKKEAFILLLGLIISKFQNRPHLTTLLSSQVNSPDRLIFVSVNVLKYDRSMSSLMFKYNVSYNTNLVNLKSSVGDKFCI